jgi:hypothetical protein
MTTEGYDYGNLLDGLPAEWAQAIDVLLRKARQMQGQDGQIVIVLKAGIPLTVRREDNTLIERVKPIAA